MWVQYEPGLVAVAVNVSLTELAVAHAVAPAANAHGETPELRRAAEQHRDYVLAHFVLRADQRLLTGRAITLTAPATFGQPDATFYQYNLLYILPEPRPAKLEISHQMLREGDYAAGTPWDITYVVRSMRSESPDVSLFLLSRDRPHSIDTGWSEPVRAIAGPTDGGSLFAAYLQQGCRHILTGYDHLLFVTALVIAAAGFWDILKLVTAFSVAHTLTLTLGTLGLFRLPAFVVEPTIALSIIIVALQNFFRPQQGGARVRLATAFGFGLVHGLGFAGGLIDAMRGMPLSSAWRALAAFSLGVEIGHQMVVIPLVGIFALRRRKAFDFPSPSQLRSGSAAIACAGAYFLLVAMRRQYFGP
jgi:hydrogenase/urease accessory protein HupE